MVAVAQLVRAPDCGSGGRGFDPHQSPITKIDLVLILYLLTLNMTEYCILKKDLALQIQPVVFLRG